MTIHEQLQAMAIVHIKSYMDDLMVHDKRDICDNPSVPFIHFTGETGTNLFFLRPYDSEYWPKKGEKAPFIFGYAGREHMLKDGLSVVPLQPNYGRDKLVMYFDGKRLKKIDQTRANSIAAEYTAKILAQWRNA